MVCLLVKPLAVNRHKYSTIYHTQKTDPTKKLLILIWSWDYISASYPQPLFFFFFKCMENKAHKELSGDRLNPGWRQTLLLVDLIDTHSIQWSQPSCPLSLTYPCCFLYYTSYPPDEENGEDSGVDLVIKKKNKKYK